MTLCLPKNLQILAITVVFATVSLVLCNPQHAFAQPANANSKNAASHNLIRAEYYAALDFIADGQTTQAIAALETALSNSRTVNGQQGIDSVPAMVMLGECYYEQSDIGMALERYDAALQVSLMGQAWLSLLKPPPGPIRADTRARDISWAPNVRGAQMSSITDAWPIVLGSTDMLLETPAGRGVVGKLVAIDAMEVLHCQAIALRRRFQLLGPLAQHNPLTRPLVEAYRVDTKGQSDAIICGINICRALAEISNGERVAAIQLLKQNLSLANGMDHPLTAIALLTLADLSIDANEVVEAHERSVEASLVAARAGQMSHLAEAVQNLAEIGFVSGHESNIAKMLQSIINWSSAKGRLVPIRGQVEWARFLASKGDVAGSKEHAVVATTMLLPTQMVLPRSEAVIRYAKAKTDFLEGKIGDGINTLYEGLAFFRGPSGGFGVPAVFQLNLAQQLIQSKALSDEVAESILTQLINPPTVGHCRCHPMEQVAWLVADKSEALRLLLEIRLRTRTEGEIVATLDQTVRMRYRQMGPLEARVFDLQQIFHGDGSFMNESDGIQAGLLRKQFSTLESNANKISDFVAHLQTNPKWDTRKWTEDETRKWDSTLKLSEAQEALLWTSAVAPVAVPEVFPPRYSPEDFAKSVDPSDAVVLFGLHGTQLKGYLYKSGQWTAWSIGDIDKVELQNLKLLNELMGLKHRDGSGSELKKHWPNKNVNALRDVLFPKEVWGALAECNRWVIVPDRFLWYVPFELLPTSNQQAALPCIASHRIIYSPTLGLVPYLITDSKQKVSRPNVDVHSADFFSQEPARAREIRDELAAVGKHTLIELSGKSIYFPGSRYFKLTAGRVGSYITSDWDKLSPVPADRNPLQSNIQTWSRLPWGTPQSIVLPGLDTLPPPTNVTGNEWLSWMLPAIAQGTRQITVSRWSVGGESAAMLMRTMQENQQDMQTSEAWQRSVVSLWEEQFDPKREPLFRNAPGANSESTIMGSHPLLWSGYINIGDAN